MQKGITRLCGWTAAGVSKLSMQQLRQEQLLDQQLAGPLAAAAFRGEGMDFT